ncbi:hypothetical protein O3P69_010997, partial [Scylla paramamosain]
QAVGRDEPGGRLHRAQGHSQGHSPNPQELRKLKPSLRHEQRRAILDKQANKQTNKQGQR